MNCVDVLAVMLGAALRDVADQRPDRASAMIEARAAVVELVASHRSLLKLVNDNADEIATHAGVHPDALNAECDRSFDALAKFAPEAGK